MKLFLWICIFLSAQSSGKAQAHRADSLLSAANYLVAGVEYERLIFEGNSGASTNELLLKKSFCFKEQNKFDQALETLQRSDFYEGNDSIRILLFNESILNAYLSSKFDLSLSLINEFRYNFENENNYTLEVLEILTLSELMKWEEARIKFIQFSDKHNLGLNSDIFDPIINHKFKKPEKALWLSYLLPGTGIIYSGAPLRGITSATFQTGAVMLVIHGLTRSYFFTSAFTGAALFYVFYNGGAQYAVNLSVKKNEEKKNDFKEELMKSLKEVKPK